MISFLWLLPFTVLGGFLGWAWRDLLADRDERRQYWKHAELRDQLRARCHERFTERYERYERLLVEAREPAPVEE